MTGCQHVPSVAESVRQLSVAFLRNPRIEPLVDGSVRIEGFALDWEFGVPSRLQQRLVRDNDGQVFEYSLSEYLRLAGNPGRPESSWIGLPLFLSKAPIQLLLVGQGASMHSLEDLRGRRLGVNHYGSGAAVWLRIMLRELYGIEAHEVEWFVSRPGGASVVGRDSNVVPVRALPPGHSMVEGLRSGELDAILDLDAALSTEGILWSNGVDGLRLLMPPDEFAEQLARFNAKTGAWPINHLVAVKAELAREHADLPRLLFDAFEYGKQIAYTRDKSARALFTVPEVQPMPAEFQDVDPYPSGLAANQATLRLMVRELTESGLIEPAVDFTRLFHSSLQKT